MFALTVAERERLFRVSDIGDSGRRLIETQSLDPLGYKPGTNPSRVAAIATTPVVRTADALFLDLPLLKGDEPEAAGYIAVSQLPRPGDVVVYQSQKTQAIRWLQLQRCQQPLATRCRTRQLGRRDVSTIPPCCMSV